MKGLCILGSTGSIGQNTLNVVRTLPERFRVVSLAAGKNLDLLARQAVEFRPQVVSVATPDCVEPLRQRLRALGGEGKTFIASGSEGQSAAATLPEVDVVVSASHGVTGLAATYAAVCMGKRVALANKETLVVAGELVTRAARERGSDILPIDSEHSALHQCLRAGERAEVRRLILTASGGPFRTTPLEEFDRVTPQQALSHPVWRMGARITIDSATMMNKGLEIIEAHWLFGLPPERIAVLIHPESIVHSVVEFQDGFLLAQLSVADMRLPIQYALTYPERLPNTAEWAGLDLAALGCLHFEAPDGGRFPCLNLARAALAEGGVFPCALNAADEVAVEAFLGGKLRFSDVPRVIEKVMIRTPKVEPRALRDVLECDREARRRAAEAVAAV
jgi:1-deoxy-D-xylulose-5-phosphate reductoisomerase